MLRGLRESRSLTQEELAERAGLTAKAIGALERGERRRPYPHTVRSLADGLALDDDERSALVAAVPSRDAVAPPALGAPLPGSAERGRSDPGASVAPRGTQAHQPASTFPTAPGTPLIGRDAEVEWLRALLDMGHRLVTITGPGGVGKTRLALEVLARESPAFPGGAAAVDLAPVRQPTLVLPRIAAALGLPEAADDDPVDALARHLRGLRVLLVLDNLEQLTGAAPVLADLLTRCPDLVVVATSRAPLQVRAEHEVVLAPLATPRDDRVQTVDSSPAAALLLERAAAAGSPLELTDRDAPAVAAICRRLDGLPLALELAAPGLRLLTPATLLERLEQTGLDAGPRDLPDRHRTLASVLDWSMDLLEPEEVDLFARLAVFSGGFSLDSVEAVTGLGDDLLPALRTLVEQSLVLRVPSPDDQPRFRLLEPVREYAAVRAQGAGVALPTAEAHATHFRDVARAAHDRLWGPRIGPVLDRLEADHANLRSAFLRLLELDRVADAAELAGSLWLHLGLRGFAREGLSWLDRVGAAGTDAAVARAAVGRMGLLLVVGDLPGIRREEAVAVPLATRCGDALLVTEARMIAGLAAVFAGDVEEGERLLTSDLPLDDEPAQRWLHLHSLLGQGQAALVRGNLASAESLLGEALAAARALGNEFTLSTTLNTVATLREVAGDEAGAAALLGESLAVAFPLRLTWTLGHAVPALAGVAARTGRPYIAAALFGAAATLGASTAVDPHFPPSRETADAGLLAARDALGERDFLAAWELGRSASSAEVAALAAQVVAELTDPGRG